MKKMGTMEWIALILVVVGALNWGLVGALDFDLVATLFGDMSTVSRIVYVLVGLSGLYLLFAAMMKKDEQDRKVRQERILF